MGHTLLLGVIGFTVQYLVGTGLPPDIYVISLSYLLLMIIYQCETAFIKSKRLFKIILFTEAAAYLVFLIFLWLAKYQLKIVFNYRMIFLSEIFWSATLIIILTSVILKGKNTIQPFHIKSFLQKLRGVYSIGLLVIIDIIIWRRVEILFLAHSPDAAFGPAIINITLQVAAIIVMVPAAVLEAWYPEISQVYLERNPEKLLSMLKAKNKKYFIFYFTLSLLTLSAFTLYFVLFLGKYHPWSIQIFAFILIRILFGFAAYYSNVIYAIRKEGTLTIGIFVCAIVSIALHWIITLKYGINGCLISYFLTQVCVIVTTLYVFNLYIPLKSMLNKNVNIDFILYKK
jgi:O-antigen/teichoic acid export membrane protein